VFGKGGSMHENPRNHGVTVKVAGILAVLWAASRLFGAFFWGQATASPDALPPGWLSVSGSALLAVAAWWSVARWREVVGLRLALGVAVGMSCGFVGDLALTQWLLQGRASFVIGLIAFGVGHAAYLVALTGELKRWKIGSIAWPLVALVGWHYAIWSAEAPPGGLVWPILAYGLSLSAVASVAASLAWDDRRHLMTALGAGAFMVSDFWIGLTVFNPDKAKAAYALLGLDVVWLTYGPAQFLIVHSVAVLALTAKKGDLPSRVEVRLDVAS
jgi:hypothetical protein